MGRCYDFGVSIDASSEMAMMVAPEGGHCQSPSTAVTCEGRFDGCAEIVAVPGRVPPSAPGWSLPTSVTPADNGVAAELHPQAARVDAATSEPTLANPNPAGSPPESGPPTEPETTSPAEPDLPQQLSATDAQPRATAPDDLSSNVGAPPIQDAQTADLIRQIAEAADEDRALAQTRDQVLNELTKSVKSLRHELAEMANDKRSASIDDLVEELVILREELDPRPVSAELARSVKETMDELAELRGPVETIGRAMLQLKNAQEQTTYAVTALRDQLRGPLTELERRSQTDLTGPDLTRSFSELHAEIGRLRPESPEIVTAGHLADTINTLRDAGIEDISAAHLIHSLQVEMRTLREEVVGIRDHITESARSAAI